MSARKIKAIRRLLVCGLISSMLLSVGTIGIFGLIGLYSVIISTIIGIGGLVFLNATPKIF